MSELAFELRDARLDLAFALRGVLGVHQQLRALFVGDRRIHHPRADGHEIAIDLIQLGAHGVELALRRSDARAQRVELTPRLVGIDERLVEVGRADAAVVAAMRADAETVRGLAELLQTLIAPRLVQPEIGRDAVLAAGIAVAADAIAGVAVDAVFIADRPPVGRQALLRAHRIAAREGGHCGEDTGGEEQLRRDDAHTSPNHDSGAQNLATGGLTGCEGLHSSQVFVRVALPFRELDGIARALRRRSIG